MKNYNVAITYQTTHDTIVTTDDETKAISQAVEQLYNQEYCQASNQSDVYVTKAEITKQWDEEEKWITVSANPISPYNSFLHFIERNAKSELVAEYLKDIITPLFRYMYSEDQKELLSAKMFVNALIDDTIKEESKNGV